MLSIQPGPAGRRMSHLGIAIVALAIAVGIAGVVVTVLPGALLV